MTDEVQEFDEVAARALATIILERTADAINEDGNNAAAALSQLADETGLTLDVVAGIMFATSAIAGIGAVDPVAVNAAALALEPDAADTDGTAPSLTDQAVS